MIYDYKEKTKYPQKSTLRNKKDYSNIQRGRTHGKTRWLKDYDLREFSYEISAAFFNKRFSRENSTNLIM